jgi:uncharacterized protein YecT (DUF1311 family)
MRRILIMLLMAAAVSTPAFADDLDGWCAQAQKASSIVICSDPELRQQALARNKLFDVAKQRLSADAFKALSDEQNGWIKAYTAACGVSVDGPPPSLPIPQSVIDCYRKESRIRTANLAQRLSEPNAGPPATAYSSPSPAVSPPVSSAAVPVPEAYKGTTGFDLYMSCAGQGAIDLTTCYKFLHGVWDGAMSVQNFGHDRFFCPKTGVQVGQIAMIFTSWARNHPADLGHDASDVALASFVEAFPCEATALPPTRPSSQTPGIPNQPAESMPSDVLLK